MEKLINSYSSVEVLGGDRQIPDILWCKIGLPLKIDLDLAIAQFRRQIKLQALSCFRRTLRANPAIMGLDLAIQAEQIRPYLQFRTTDNPGRTDWGPICNLALLIIRVERHGKSQRAIRDLLARDLAIPGEQTPAGRFPPSDEVAAVDPNLRSQPQASDAAAN